MLRKRRLEKTNPICRKTQLSNELRPAYHNILCRADLKQGLPFGVAIPNRATRKAFADTNAGRNLVVCKDVEDMFKRLGI